MSFSLSFCQPGAGMSRHGSEYIAHHRVARHWCEENDIEYIQKGKLPIGQEGLEGLLSDFFDDDETVRVVKIDDETLRGPEELKEMLSDTFTKEQDEEITPDNILFCSSKKVWWKCQCCGYEWQADLYRRIHGSGCQKCSVQKRVQTRKENLPFEKTLAYRFPEIAKEWNYEKNGDLKPTQVMKGCGKKVWWRCDKGHEWQAKIADRSMQHGCPYCMGKRVLKGFNDLITLYPNLVNEYWDYDKNHEIADPSNCGKGSNKKVWWKCNKGHEWQATIASFVKTGRCPYCAGFKVLPGMNDITVTNPEVIKEWDYEKNEEL